MRPGPLFSPAACWGHFSVHASSETKTGKPHPGRSDGHPRHGRRRNSTVRSPLPVPVSYSIDSFALSPLTAFHTTTPALPSQPPPRLQAVDARARRRLQRRAQPRRLRSPRRPRARGHAATSARRTERLRTMGRSMDYLLHTMTAATNSSPDNGGGDNLLSCARGSSAPKHRATRENERESKYTHEVAARKLRG